MSTPVEGMLAKDAFSRWLGIDVISLRAGHCVVGMTVRDEMVNGFGVAHGGIAFSLADSAMAFAANHGENVTVAVDNAVSYPAAVRVGDALVATAEEERSTSQLAFYRVTVKRDDVVVALFRGTVYRTRKRHDPESIA